MDRAQLSMQVEADMLDAGADLMYAPDWMHDIIRDIGAAYAGCEHVRVDGNVAVPLCYYPTGLHGPTVTCGRCAKAPLPVCQVCGAAATEGVSALSGLLLVMVALCDAHMKQTLSL